MRTLSHDGYTFNVISGDTPSTNARFGAVVTAEQYSLTDTQLLGYLIRNGIVPNNHDNRYLKAKVYAVQVQPWKLGLVSYPALAYLDAVNQWRYQSTDLPVEGTVTSLEKAKPKFTLVQLTHELHVLAQAIDHQTERKHNLCVTQLRKSFFDVLKEIEYATN
jgi:hypothetical protein